MNKPVYHICSCIECGAWPVRADETGKTGVCPAGHHVPVYVTEELYVKSFENKNDQCGSPGCTRPVEARGFKRCRPCIVQGAKNRKAS
jgi:hypothetical protein